LESKPDSGVTTNQPSPIGGRVAKAFAGSLTRTAVGHAAALVAVIVIARNVSVSDYGLYAIAAVLVGLLYTLIALPLSWSIVALGERGLGNPASAARAVWGMLQAGYGVVALIAILSAWAAPAGVRGILIGAAVYMGSVPLRFPAQVELQRTVNYSTLARIEIVEVLVFQGTACTLVLIGAGASSFGIALGLTGIAGGVAGVVVKRPWRGPSTTAAIGLVLRGTRPYLAIVTATMVRDNSGPLLLAGTAGAASAGVWGWSMSMSSVVLVAGLLGPPILFSALSARKDAGGEVAAADLLRASRLLTLMAAVAAAALVASLPSIIDAVFSPEWSVARPTIWILAATGIVTAIGAGAFGRASTPPYERVAASASVIGVAIMLGVGLPLSLALGAAGFALGFLAGAVVAVGVTVFGLARREIREVVPLRCAGAIIVSALVGATAGLACGHLLHSIPLAGVFISAGVAGTLTAMLAIAWPAGRILRSDVAEVWALLRLQG